MDDRTVSIISDTTLPGIINDEDADTLLAEPSNTYTTFLKKKNQTSCCSQQLLKKHTAVSIFESVFSLQDNDLVNKLLGFNLVELLC